MPIPASPDEASTSYRLYKERTYSHVAFFFNFWVRVKALHNTVTRFRMLLFYLLSLAAALPGQRVILCTKDALYTSLAEHGRAFCSQVLDAPCEASTPAEFATFDANIVSSRVSGADTL